MSSPNCLQCQSPYVYQDQDQWVCPECGFEWNPNEQADQLAAAAIKDANGQALQAGDKVTIIKDLKVKGSSQVLKIGSKAVIKRVIDGDDHQLDCKLAKGGEMMITAKFVKKS